MPTRPKISLVRYCPGDSCGSPAHLTPTEAQIQLEKDTHHLNTLERTGTTVKSWPHTGPCSPQCRYVRE
jgi:hypothetical protein